MMRMAIFICSKWQTVAKCPQTYDGEALVWGANAFPTINDAVKSLSKLSDCRVVFVDTKVGTAGAPLLGKLFDGASVTVETHGVLSGISRKASAESLTENAVITPKNEIYAKDFNGTSIGGFKTVNIQNSEAVLLGGSHNIKLVTSEKVANGDTTSSYSGTWTATAAGTLCASDAKLDFTADLPENVFSDNPIWSQMSGTPTGVYDKVTLNGGSVATIIGGKMTRNLSGNFKSHGKTLQSSSVVDKYSFSATGALTANSGTIDTASGYATVSLNGVSVGKVVGGGVDMVSSSVFATDNKVVESKKKSTAKSASVIGGTISELLGYKTITLTNAKLDKVSYSVDDFMGTYVRSSLKNSDKVSKAVDVAGVANINGNTKVYSGLFDYKTVTLTGTGVAVSGGVSCNTLTKETLEQGSVVSHNVNYLAAGKLTIAGATIFGDVAGYSAITANSSFSVLTEHFYGGGYSEVSKVSGNNGSYTATWSAGGKFVMSAGTASGFTALGYQSVTIANVKHTGSDAQVSFSRVNDNFPTISAPPDIYAGTLKVSSYKDKSNHQVVVTSQTNTKNGTFFATNVIIGNIVDYKNVVVNGGKISGIVDNSLFSDSWVMTVSGRVTSARSKYIADGSATITGANIEGTTISGYKVVNIKNCGGSAKEIYGGSNTYDSGAVISSVAGTLGAANISGATVGDVCGFAAVNLSAASVGVIQNVNKMLEKCSSTKGALALNVTGANNSIQGFVGGADADKFTVAANAALSVVGGISVVDFAGGNNVLSVGKSAVLNLNDIGINFGTGNDKVSIEQGARLMVDGEIDFGNGGNTFSVTGSATIFSLRFGDGKDTVTVNKGASLTLQNNVIFTGGANSVKVSGDMSVRKFGMNFGSDNDTVSVEKNARLDIGGKVDFSAGNNKFTVAGVARVGGVTFGGGDDNFSVTGGCAINGDFALGAGKNNLSVSGKLTYLLIDGNLSATSEQSVISIASGAFAGVGGDFDLKNNTSLKLSGELAIYATDNLAALDKLKLSGKGTISVYSDGVASLKHLEKYGVRVLDIGDKSVAEHYRGVAIENNDDTIAQAKNMLNWIVEDGDGEENFGWLCDSNDSSKYIWDKVDYFHFDKGEFSALSFDGCNVEYSLNGTTWERWDNKFCAKGGYLRITADDETEPTSYKVSGTLA